MSRSLIQHMEIVKCLKRGSHDQSEILRVEAIPELAFSMFSCLLLGRASQTIRWGDLCLHQVWKDFSS